MLDEQVLELVFEVLDVAFAAFAEGSLREAVLGAASLRLSQSDVADMRPCLVCSLTARIAA